MMKNENTTQNAGTIIFQVQTEHIDPVRYRKRVEREVTRVLAYHVRQKNITVNEMNLFKKLTIQTFKKSYIMSSGAVRSHVKTWIISAMKQKMEDLKDQNEALKRMNRENREMIYEMKKKLKMQQNVKKRDQ